MRRIARGIGKGLLALLAVIITVALGKACQYAAVDRFGPRLGFGFASAIGLTPFVLVLIAVDVAWRRRAARR